MFNIKTKPIYDINKLDQLKIWCDIIGKTVVLEERFASPFRGDAKTKLCTLNLVGDMILFSSFNPMDKPFNGWNCVKAYSYLRSLSYINGIKELFENPSNVFITQPRQVSTKSIKTLQPLIIDWNKEGLDYWHKKGVFDLEFIYQIEGCKTSDYDVIFTKLAFAYQYENKYKVYVPFAEDKKNKWLSGCRHDDTWYIDNGCDIILVCKAAKDQKMIQSILKDSIDYIHCQGEQTIVKIPRDYARKIAFMDNDEAGRIMSDKYERLGYEIIQTPEDTKDFDLYYMKHGRLKSAIFLANNLNIEIKMTNEPKYIIFNPDKEFEFEQTVNNKFGIDYSISRIKGVFKDIGFKWVDTLEDIEVLLADANDQIDNTYFLWGTDGLNPHFAEFCFQHYVCFGDFSEFITYMKSFRNCDLKQWFNE